MVINKATKKRWFVVGLKPYRGGLQPNYELLYI
jgi:hypothetical protein